MGAGLASDYDILSTLAKKILWDRCATSDGADPVGSAPGDANG